MQECHISSSLSNTDSNEESNPIQDSMPLRYGLLRYAVVDVEIGLTDHRIHDIGALRYDGAIYHKASKEELLPFLKRVEYLCGHNIIHHDAKYLFEDRQIPWRLVDTLYLSPLLFPERPYHRLVKDDKLVSDQMNNPVNDCEKARDLLLDEMARWNTWSEQKRELFTALLRSHPEFDGFLDLMGAGPKDCNLSEQIATVYRGRICQNVELEPLIEHYPCELVYALALVFVFLALAALYESWGLPLAILMSVPVAVLGAVLFIGVSHLLNAFYVNDIYMQISLVMLIGLAAKNAILVVEYADRLFNEQGASLMDAAIGAAKLRVRPIIMTAFAFILGVMPLIFASGVYATARNIMGVALVGGMLFATLLGIFVYPALYYFVGRIGGFERRRERKKQEQS